MSGTKSNVTIHSHGSGTFLAPHYLNADVTVTLSEGGKLHPLIAVPDDR